MSDDFKKELEQLKKQQTEQKEDIRDADDLALDDTDEFEEMIEQDTTLAAAKHKEESKDFDEEDAKEKLGTVETKKEIDETVKKQHIFALRTTANREDQVMDFVTSNVKKKKLQVFSVIRPHGMRGYIFVEASARGDAEQAAFNVPYARGLLPKEIEYVEIEHMLEQVKKEVNIRKNDIAEIISGPFKREKCKVTRIDKTKEEVVVELLEAAVPIPITVKMDAIKVIRRENEDDSAEAGQGAMKMPSDADQIPKDEEGY